MGLLEALCGCLKLTVKEKRRKNESKSKELSGEKKRRKLDSESTEKKDNKVGGSEGDSEIAEGIPFEEHYHDSMDGESYKFYLPTTPHNSTCSQEADTEMTKFFILFWLNISIGGGEMFTCLHSAA